MYDELVKSLREDHGKQYFARDMEAADAIEELSKLADAIPHVCECCIGCEMEKKNGGCDNAFVLSPKRAMQYLIKPRWISVEERLPLAYKDVYVTDGEYIARTNLLGDVFPGDQPCWSYSGLGEITHWCERIPLPKEE